MKRKIILLVVSTALTGGAMFGMYRLAGPTRALLEDADPGGRADGNAPALPAGFDRGPEAGDITFIKRNDATRRLEYVLKVRDWRKGGEKEYHFVQPRVEVHLRDGQRVLIEADEGTAHAEEVASRFEPRRGTLRGNVRIRLVPAAGPDRDEPPPDATTRVQARTLTFDNDLLHLSTDGPVAVWSPRADVVGSGLTLRWHESPRELALLRIDKGGYMAIHQVPKELGDFSLTAPKAPDGPAGPAAQAASSGENAPRRAPSAPPGRARTMPPAAGSGGPGARDPNGPTPRRGPRRGPSAKPADRYVASFHEHVRVSSSRGRIDGAETLSLLFPFDPAQADSLTARPTGPADRGPRRDANAAADLPPPGARASPRPTNPEPAQDGGAGPDRATDETLRVYWDGPLEIRPVRRPARRSTARTSGQGAEYVLDAHGQRLTLTSGPSRATCRQFSYITPEHWAQLLGDANRPVVLELPDGERAECRSMYIDRREGWTRMEGEGVLTRPAHRSQQTPTPPGMAAGARAEEPAVASTAALDRDPLGSRASGGERISWTRLATARFSEVEAIELDEGASAVRLRDANFFGDVTFTVADSNDRLFCQELQLDMKVSADGNALPGKVTARTDVSARQGDSTIDANQVEVWFRPGPAPRGRGVDGEQDPNRPFHAHRLRAVGEVRLAGAGGRGEAPIRAACDELIANLDDSSAILTGRPATVAQDGNRISARELFLKRHERRARVDGQWRTVVAERVDANGPGSLAFLTDRDLDGNRLAEPRPMTISWQRGMDFHGEEDLAVFEGDVKLLSGPDRLDCRRMTVQFERRDDREPEPDDARASREATPEEGGLGALRFTAGNRRTIRTISASGEVTLAIHRRRTNPDALRKLTLMTPDELTYDANDRFLQVMGRGDQEDGRGKLLIEDYSPPRRRRRGGAGATAGYLASPSQTVFRWSKSMTLDGNDLTVTMLGDVYMVHRSGGQVVLADRLDLPIDLVELPEGRKTTLATEKLVAMFSPASARDAQGGARTLDEGFTGNLDRFIAKGDVRLEDAEARVDECQLMVYDRLADVVRLMGEDVPGADGRRNVNLRYEDRKTGSLQRISAPVILWHPAARTARAEKVRVTGSTPGR